MHSRSLLQDRVSPLRCCGLFPSSCYALTSSALSRSLSLADAARCGARLPRERRPSGRHRVWLPHRQVYVELHRRQPRLCWRRHPETIREKIKLANLTSDLPTPVASTSAPLSTCSASVAVVVNSTSNDMLNSFVFDSFVLPQNNIELAVELAFLVPTAVSPTCTIFTTCPSSTDCGTTTTSPLAAGVDSPWNLTLPGGAKDPADHALFNAGFGNSVSLIPALADAVPQIEGASAGMPFIASPSIFTDGSCDDASPLLHGSTRSSTSTTNLDAASASLTGTRSERALRRISWRFAGSLSPS